MYHIFKDSINLSYSYVKFFSKLLIKLFCFICLKIRQNSAFFYAFSHSEQSPPHSLVSVSATQNGNGWEFRWLIATLLSWPLLIIYISDPGDRASQAVVARTCHIGLFWPALGAAIQSTGQLYLSKLNKKASFLRTSPV